MELIACPGETTEPHAFKAVMNLQVSKAHLDALALVARLEKGLRPHQPACHITGILVNIAGDLSCRHIWTALHLERTTIAVELGGAIPKHAALVQGPSGM